MSKLQHCIYVLLSQKDQKFYIGYSSNFKQRLTDHFNGNAQATAPRRSFSLVFCEYFLSKSDALRREKYLKTTVGKKGLRLIIRESLTELSSQK